MSLISKKTSSLALFLIICLIFHVSAAPSSISLSKTHDKSSHRHLPFSPSSSSSSFTNNKKAQSQPKRWHKRDGTLGSPHLGSLKLGSDGLAAQQAHQQQQQQNPDDPNFKTRPVQAQFNRNSASSMVVGFPISFGFTLITFLLFFVLL